MLRFKGGDVIVALGPEIGDHLLLHADVLKAASPFFEASMKACWDQNAEPKTVTSPTSGEEVKIYKYSLVNAGGLVTLHLKV